MHKHHQNNNSNNEHNHNNSDLFEHTNPEMLGLIDSHKQLEQENQELKAQLADSLNDMEDLSKFTTSQTEENKKKTTRRKTRRSKSTNHYVNN